MNPWSAADWNLTEQGRYIKRYGVEAGARLARSVGSSLGALKPIEQVIHNRIFVIKGKPGADGKDAAVDPILGFMGEGPFIALEQFALAPTPQGMRFPSAKAALSSATCLFAPTADCTLTLALDAAEYLASGDGMIAQITFNAGSQIGSFTWAPPLSVSASSRLWIITPAVADPVFGGVQLLFRGDAT